MKDLVILAADKDMKVALSALLKRTRALGICPISPDVWNYPNHDSACASEGVAYLNGFHGKYAHALLIFDYEGCGKESSYTPEELEKALTTQFQNGPWKEDARVIVISPELENWIWSDSPHVSGIIGWKGGMPALQQWLRSQGWLPEGRGAKPQRPKEAFRAALQAARKSPGSHLFQQLAEKVSFQRCTDRSFSRFCQTLREWFPIED